LLNAFALKTVNPSVVSVYIYLQPLVATLIALLWGKDTLTWEKVAAGALIFIGVYLVSRQKAIN
jgi:drug/metabolite transporter (DMT)-like permease